MVLTYVRTKIGFWVIKRNNIQCSLSSTISRVCTHSGASCRKTNSPARLCCRYQAKHSKLTEEICLLSEATIYPANSNSRENLGILARFPCFLSIFKLVFFCSVTGETVEVTTDQRNSSIIGSDDVHISS